MNKPGILKDLESANPFLREAVADFPDNNFNLSLQEGKWSAAGILEHLLLVETSVNQMLQLPAGAAPRVYDEKKQHILNVFSDDSRQYDAPSDYLPSGKMFDKNNLLQTIMGERAMLAMLIHKLDLTETSESFRHPGFGSFTRYEWVEFVIHHSNRHARQIKKLARF